MIFDILAWVGAHPLTALLIFAVVVAGAGAIFALVTARLGAETVAGMIRALWRGRAPVLAFGLALPLLAGCAAIPNTTAAYRTGGVGAAIDEFLTQTGTRIVAICQFTDRPRIAATLTLGAEIADADAALEAIRADRRAWCGRLGGTLLLDVQD